MLKAPTSIGKNIDDLLGLTLGDVDLVQSAQIRRTPEEPADVPKLSVTVFNPTVDGAQPVAANVDLPFLQHASSG